MASAQKLAQVLQSMVPIPRPSLPEDALTPGQMNGLQYSRDRYADNSYILQPPTPGTDDRDVTSFMGAISQLPDGSYINYPTFWGGKVLDPKTALNNALQYEAKTGKAFARYPTIDAANAGESQVHNIMSSDADALQNTPSFKAKAKER